MPMMSLDDADGGRCGGMSTASREDGHAHDWIGEGFHVSYIFSLSRRRESSCGGVKRDSR